MSIQTKLIFLSIFSLIGTILIGLILLQNTLTIKKEIEKQTIISEIRSQLFERVILRDQYLLYHDQRPIDQLTATSKNLELFFAQADKLFTSSEEQKSLGIIRENSASNDESLFQMIANSARQDNAEIAVSDEVENKLKSQILIRSEESADKAAQLSVDSRNNVYASVRRTTLFSEIFFATAVIIILFVLYFIWRSIVLPLISLKGAAVRIASLDFSTKTDMTRKDELGILSQSLNSMAGKLKESYETLEKRVADRTKDLEVAKARDEALLASIGDGVVAVDKDAKIIFLNKVGADLLGLTIHDMLGKEVLEAFKIKDEKGVEVPVEKRPLYTALNEAKSTITSTSGTTYYYFRKDRNPIPVAINATPITIDGQIVGAVEVFRDITREKEIDRQKSEFISLASHQLRTPLGSMRWNLEILESDMKSLPKSARERLHEAYNSNLRIIHLVADLLNITRIEQGRFVNEMEITDITKILQSAVDEMQPEAKKTGVGLDIKIKKPKIADISIDPKRFREVIQNLLSNAVKYTLSGGKVLVEIDSTDKTIEIAISDSGIGIPEKDKARIFTKFARAENATRVDAEGSGLGLYIVKSFVDGWGGKIWFESQEKKGSTFYISLPFAVKVTEGTNIF